MHDIFGFLDLECAGPCSLPCVVMRAGKCRGILARSCQAADVKLLLPLASTLFTAASSSELMLDALLPSWHGALVPSVFPDATQRMSGNYLCRARLMMRIKRAFAGTTAMSKAVGRCVDVCSTRCVL